MMMREFPPSTTCPGTGVAGSLSFAAASLLVATSNSRTPPCAGDAKSCDSSRSPSTTTTAFTVSPGGTSSNCARPLASVFTVRTVAPICSSIGKLGMLLERSPRMSRTEIEWSGRSVTGRGMPDICFGSNNWVETKAERTQRTPRTQRKKPIRVQVVWIVPVISFVSFVSFVFIQRLSKLDATTFTEPRVCIVDGRARGTGRHGSRLLWTRGFAQSPREVAFDLITVPRAGIELPHQACGPRAEATGHVPPVRFGHLPHRAIELELLDRSQRQHLFPLERHSRAITDHRRAIVLRRDERPQHPQRGEADERRRADDDAEEDDRREALRARNVDDRSGAAKSGEHEELPRLETLVRLKPDATIDLAPSARPGADTNLACGVRL